MYEILRYIHENIKEPLTLVGVAEHFGYSRWHFCVKFREYAGRSFVKYVRHFRIQLAAMDILMGKRISDVAFAYGYDSLGGFHKAFLAEFGCYPSDYKKNTGEALLYHERRKYTMYQLSDRCELLRHAAVEGHEYEARYAAQHRVYTTVARSEAREAELDQNTVMARHLCGMLDQFTPVILPGERIVGFNFGKEEMYLPLDDDQGRESLLRSDIPDEVKARYFPHKADNFLVVSEVPGLTEVEMNTEKEWASIGRCVASNHTVLGYERVLRLGFSGLLREVEKYEKQNGASPFYDALKAVCLSASEMGRKYANEARRCKESGDSAYSVADLDEIIAVCERVPRYPATSFREAVQALWFAHVVNTWEDYINANSLGRLDQILYPYYKADIERGVLTREDAFELICCLWIKLYRDYDVQQSCIGGTDEFGQSAVNELSYMMLDATEQLDFVRCLSVRFSQKTEKDFLRRALEVVGHVQKGVPFFFNDDVMIPALKAKGISAKDASDYTQIGCVETVIPGKANPHAVTGQTNLLKAMEYVLANGYSMAFPEMKNGISTGTLDSFSSFESFYAAILCQIEHILDVTCSKVRKHRDAACVLARPYKSLLTEGCLESGRDFNDGGARYDYYQIMLGGVPNLADSLEVIRKFVYEEKAYTLSEIKDILDADFPDESIRQRFINKAAKYGNDIDSVDSLAADLVDKCCDILEALSDKYGLSFHAQPFTFYWMVDHGRLSAASPDGRRCGEIIAYSLSPMQGRDFNGLTALFNSIAKLPTDRTPGTTSAIVEIDPKLFSDRNLSALTEILYAAGAQGLENVQFNTVDANTLIDAQCHPERYNNLAVRVSGFSQRFNLLCPELQNHIIARTKHTCL